MAKKVICENCKEVLEPTSKDYVVCGNCGEFNWVGSEDKVETEPDLRERLRIAREKIMKSND
jgi:Zn finger protein HypA/HybF involved in hydrogenase expression